jgi:hypothetical protein
MKYPTGTRIAGVSLPLLFGMAYASLANAQVRPAVPDTMPIRTGAMLMADGVGAMMTGPHHALAMAYGESLATFARVMNGDASRSQMVNVELAKPATIEMRRSFEQMKVHHTAQMGSMSAIMQKPLAADSAAAMMRSARRDSLTMPMQAGSRRAAARPKPMTPPMRPDSMRPDSMMSRPMTMPIPMRADSLNGAGMGDMAPRMASIEKHLSMIETEVNATTPNTALVIEHTAEIVKICAAAMQMPPQPMMDKPRSPGAP